MGSDGRTEGVLGCPGWAPCCSGPRGCVSPAPVSNPRFLQNANLLAMAEATYLGAIRQRDLRLRSELSPRKEMRIAGRPLICSSRRIPIAPSQARMPWWVQSQPAFSCAADDAQV